MPRTEKGTTSKASSTHKKPTDKKPTASHQKDKSHHPATLKDLGELDLKKYDDAITKALKLEEEKADLNEECDTKDSEITRLQQQYEEEAGSNRANVNRLTDRSSSGTRHLLFRSPEVRVQPPSLHPPRVPVPAPLQQQPPSFPRSPAAR